MSRKEKPKKKKGLYIFISILFILAIVAGNQAAAFQWKFQKALGLMDRDTSGVIANVEDELLKEGNDLLKSDDVINILLVGADKRESWKERGRSDSCMIATIDKKTGQLKLTSLMRDMYVEIPGHGKHKFNAAYSYGGVELLYKTIVKNFGISVEGYALVDFAAFRKVINELGGVEIELTDEEYQILMKRYHRTSVLKLKKGKNNMNGTQALAYCRLRQDKLADFGRTQRQRNVIMQIFKKMKAQPLNKWFDTMSVVMPEISTDLTDGAIMQYIKDVVFLGTTEIEQLRLPVNGSYTGDKINGQDVLIIDLAANKKAVKEFIYGKEAKKADKAE